jgi:hypothetical protein
MTTTERARLTAEKSLETRRRRNARGLDEIHLDCRLLRHSWTRVADTNENPPMFGVRVCYECNRCGSSRCDVVQRSTGGLLHRTYGYTVGYELESIDGERPVNADALRWEMIRRLDQNAPIPGVPDVGEPA